MLTVLMATRNRAPTLRDVLASYGRPQQPSSGWKLVVIDNGSTDETATVIASFKSRLPIQFASEPRSGKNYALNTGLDLVDGDLVVFTDDDAFPRPDWLVQLREVADTQAAYSMFGGAIVPRWEVPPPRWIEWLDVRPVYTISSPELKAGPIHSSLVFGPNMAVRAGILESGIRFNPYMGPRGTTYPMGSETEFTLRLEQQGHKAWFAPSAIVEHYIRKSQLTKSWVMQRAVRFGRGQYRLCFAEEAKTRKLLLGMPRYLFREIYNEGLLFAKAWLSRRHEDLFRSRWRLNFLRGKAIEARILVRELYGQEQSSPFKA